MQVSRPAATCTQNARVLRVFHVTSFPASPRGSCARSRSYDLWLRPPRCCSLFRCIGEIMRGRERTTGGQRAIMRTAREEGGGGERGSSRDDRNRTREACAGKRRAENPSAAAARGRKSNRKAIIVAAFRPLPPPPPPRSPVPPQGIYTRDNRERFIARCRRSYATFP